jgi:hypothetical protein
MSEHLVHVGDWENCNFKEDALLKKRELRWTPNAVVVFSIALAIGLADVHSAIAGCGGYCEARQVRAICHQAISIKGLKGHERDVDFEKCKADPTAYLQLEELADDLENRVD